ncbi:leucine dehydrogenase [Algoriphagus ornithinivorans]|jgi:leucine dehydrogenase|uniref:Leucine dehydrogenase n=3 Tax=Algoriphagus TaxID=246875 RepID=A0A1I5ESZ4_9BACT|nr:MULTISPECIES: Glu/Leu/Phe/Val dehydrogenase dimerization domain-containing protein [Algoriphagus]MAL12344.1 Glu/Leu/Phe/Val dehydrogenase [Algoriphagus sp.]QYH40197.1 Glu/Leu/Phe/Val dehydrogenase [Algoriphagus sp. NBT04N3]SFO14577.1 leucine dehydrogenase [Algoriphagus ornithinivorans]HAH38209.1 Glu/Leu/Phe/Val dehydrogenase [Algoriphagus sp.]HAZ24761.1 Glu/Leu/Phe/Val dehydrogenase [Algoriphagus sp.]|tara:strand:- start:2859 stop:3959 length:1101 start_codon:yes stop_codon:yes gene_type:complete
MLEIKASQTVKEGSIFGQISSMDHEQLVVCHDEATGLKALIGIHNTTLGPALGGTRMWPYATEEEAITDVLRLSRGMTFKNALAGLNLGGGKAVIIGDPKLKNEAFLRRFGRFVQSLGGRYVTAEDVNMKTSDMEYIAMETKHVTGLPEIKGGGGDPSPVTAYGTYMGMKAAAKKAFGSDSLSGKKICVQGVGQVGKYLIEYLIKEGAEVLITDIFEDKLKKVALDTGAVAIDPNLIYDMDMDIYAPCALGATINDDTIDRLKCAVIAGGANNQLKDEAKHGQILLEKGIIYAPDFLINAGGVINVGAEYFGGYNREIVYKQAEKIYDTCLYILNKSEKENIPAQQAAIEAAKERINAIGRVKLSF